MVNAALKLIKDSESLVLTPYRDQGKGVVTIGYGNTFYEDGTHVKMTDKPLTKARAEQLFTNISNAFERDVKKEITSSVNSNQLGALTSLAYNIGMGNFRGSTILKVVNKNPNDPIISDLFNSWNKSGSKILNGLVIRRKKEYALYKRPCLNLTLFIPAILFFYSVLAVTL
ncbi:lysozyme [Flavobacterium sp. ZT3R17]|uniref:lysozyme n=1 Tax=Flavobacterium cryoconiti TaxID=3398736 RepID=UPI003A87D33E